MFKALTLICLLLAVHIHAEEDETTLSAAGQKALSEIRALRVQQYAILDKLEDDDRFDIEDIIEKDTEEHEQDELADLEAAVKDNSGLTSDEDNEDSD
ncbi:unnamed protein product, partial [Mesorhabditis spiculigera]